MTVLVHNGHRRRLFPLPWISTEDTSRPGVCPKSRSEILRRMAGDMPDFKHDGDKVPFRVLATGIRRRG